MKLQLLADLDRKQGTKKEIDEKNGIPHKTLSTIIKNRAKLERPDLSKAELLATELGLTPAGVE